MKATRWQRLKSLYESAMDFTVVRRREYLAGMTGRETASDLRRLLEQQDNPDGFLEQPAFAPRPPNAEQAETAVTADAPFGRPGPDETNTATLRAFWAGEIVDERFRIVRFIAHGGMGDVYEAEDLAHSRRPHIALKTVRPEIAANRRIAEQFESEIEIGKTVTHHNVCRIYDLGIHRDPPDAAGITSPPIMFLTMELLNGRTLADQIRAKQPMQLSEAARILEQVCAGLHAAHQAHIVHRDLKPGNIMLVPGGEQDGVRAVITDFGLARERADPRGSAPSEVGAGTPDYMSPEQVEGKPLDQASDIYALGVVAYQMVTGRLPFAGEHARIRMIKRLHEAPVPPRVHVPSLPETWQTTILRCLERDPVNRFANTNDVIGALEGNRQVTGAGRGPLTVTLPVLTHRRVFAGTCLVAVLVGAWFGWQRWSQSRSQPTPEAARLYQQGVDDIHAGAYFAATKALGRAVEVAPGFSPARARLAESWFELDLPERAAREFLPIRRRDNSSLPALDQLQIEAVDLTITREFGAAVAKYEQMLHLRGGGTADLNVDLGRAYEKAGKPDQAIEAYQRAAGEASRSPAAWLRLGVLYSQRSKAAESEHAFGKADQLYRLTSNMEGLTEVALQSGVAANNHGQLAQAAKLLQSASELAHNSGNLQQEISAKLTLANNAYAAGDAALAETYARDSLATAQASQMEALTIRGFINLGNAYLRKADMEGAEKHLQDALALARRTNSARLSALSLLTLAALHDRLNRSDDQIREAREALDYYQHNHLVQQTFQGLALIGRGESDRGNYSGALDSFQKLLASAEKANDRGQKLIAEENLADVYFAEEQYPKALEHYQAFLVASVSAEKTGYAALACGKTFWRLGKYGEAGAKLKQADEAARQFPLLQLSILRSRAEMLLSQKHWPEAAAIAQRFLASDGGKTPLMVATMTKIAGLAWVRSGKREAGRKKCEEALSAGEGLKDLSMLLDARMAALEARLATHDPAGAVSVFHQMEPTLKTHPESRWFALALLSESDRQYASPAREAINGLAAEWGDTWFRQYVTRPDVLKIAWPLLQTNYAKH